MRVVVTSHKRELIQAVMSSLASDVPCRTQSFHDFIQLYRRQDSECLSIVDAEGIDVDDLITQVRRCCVSDYALLVIAHNRSLFKELQEASADCRGLFDVLLWSDLAAMLPWKVRMYERIMRHDREFRDAKEAEARLRYSEEGLQEIADCMPLLIWRTDASGVVNYNNKRWYKYTGARGFDDWSQVLHPEDAQKIVAAWTNSTETGEDFLVECRIREAESGEYYWHLARAAPIRDAQGKITKWFGFSVNIDPFKRSSLQVERLVVQLDSANRLKDEFLATLSHELRTPLNVVLGHAELLSNDSDELSEQERSHSLATLVRNAEMLSRLVDDILDVGKIITGKLSIHVDSTNIQEIVVAVVDSLQVTWKAKDLTVHTQCSEVPALIADEDRIRQVIWNLLTNAIKFTPSGGRIDIHVREENGQAVVEVKDSGLGIEREFLPRVFERFSQQDGSVARRFGGLGLGLAIVRHIIELHGGSVEVESEGAGKGTTFRVRLPIVPAVPYEASTKLGE